MAVRDHGLVLVLTRRPGQAIMIGESLEVGLRQLPGEEMTLSVASQHPVPVEGTNHHLTIGHSVEVQVLAVMKTKARIGIEAPRRVPVFRKEVYEDIHGRVSQFERRDPTSAGRHDTPDVARWLARGGRRALALAGEEARLASSVGAPVVGSGYVLVGLLGVEGGVAAGALETLGVRAQDARARLASLRHDDARIDHSFSARVRRVLDLAHRYALVIGNGRIDTEHILLGILRAGRGDAARVLEDLGLRAEDIRDQVVRELIDRGWRPPQRRR